MDEVPYAVVRMSEGVSKRIAELKHERDEAHQQVEQAEQLSEARLIALRQYAGHHSGCGECYKIWAKVNTVLEIDTVLAVDQPAEAGGE